MNIYRVGAELLPADRQTDRRTEWETVMEYKRKTD